MSKTNKRRVVVTGGCGYIGSHTIVDLIQHGFEVISVDSLVNSRESVLKGVEEITGVAIKNYRIDLSIQDAWEKIAEHEKDIDGIIHFAAFKAVGESVIKPLDYYQNNIGGLLQVLEWMKQEKIQNIIFSSSCTVYGNTRELPVKETTEFNECSSPYGRTKQMGEWIIQDYVRTSQAKAISLRYFNPAGAHDSLLIGEESFDPPLNLIPVIAETAIGKRDSFTVFGNDYETNDGTCVRDYIHVMDIAHAHTLALKHLVKDHEVLSFDAFNLGMEKGLSVLELINTFEKVNNLKVNYQLGDRRVGDMAEIYANSRKAFNALQWQPKKTIDDIVRSAWEWEFKKKKSV